MKNGVPKKNSFFYYTIWFRSFGEGIVIYFWNSSIFRIVGISSFKRMLEFG